MSQSMILFQPNAGGVPAHIINSQNAVALNANAQQGIRLSFPILSIDGKRWSVVYRGTRTVIQKSDGTDPHGRPLPVAPVRSLEVVVVGISPHISKAFYLAAYQNDGKFRLPDCFSSNSQTPDPSAPNKQSELCETCAKNQWESATNPDGSPAKGKACSDAKKIVLVPNGDIDNAAYGGPMMLRVPATSLQNLAKYGGQLDLAGYDITQVVTSLSFDPAITHQVIVFGASDFIRSPVDYEKVCDWARSDIVRRMLDEMPETEVVGVPPVRPTREQFLPPNEESSWIKAATDKFYDEPDPERWIKLLDDMALACTTMADLAELRAVGPVKNAEAKAPLAYLARMRKIFDEAVERLSPGDEPDSGLFGRVDQGEPNGAAEPTASVEHDSDGVVWDPTKHASSRVKNTNGTWRARKRVEKTATIPPAAILENGKVTPVETTAFSAWLLDHEGEGIGDDPIDDPVKWAHAYVAAKADLFPDDVEAFETNNHDAAREAMIASTDVSGILAPKRVTDSPKAVMGAEPVEIDPAFVPAPTKPTKTEYDSYMARLEAVLAMEDTDEWVSRVEMANLAVYSARPPSPGAFPEVRRLKCLGLVADRRAAIRPALAHHEAPITDFIALHDGMLKDIASWETVEKFDQWRNYGPVKAEFTNLLQGDSALYHKVMEATDARRVVLGIFEKLKARVLACGTEVDAMALIAEPGYLSDVKAMASDPLLFPQLKRIAVDHLATIQARGAT